MQIKREEKRNRRIISLILSAAMVFTMNIPIRAAEVGEYEAGIESYGEDTAENEAGLKEYTSEAAEYETDTAELTEAVTRTSDSGWRCVVASSNVANTVFSAGSGESAKYTRSVVEVGDGNFKVDDMSLTGPFDWHSKGVNLKYYGSLSCGSLMLDVGSYDYKMTHWKKPHAYPNRIKYMADNTITINVTKGDLENAAFLTADDYEEEKKDAYLEVLVVKKSNTEYLKHYGFIEEKCINFELDNDLTLERLKGSRTIDGKIYVVFRVRTNGMYNNEPTQSANMVVGNYTISYFQKIPFFGKKKRLRMSNSVKSTLGTIVASDNTTGKIYMVKKVKISRLKNVPANQGPFPTVSNAGLQIIKLALPKGDKAGKRMQKELKKLTKVDKKTGWQSQALPLIIYPRRLTNEVSDYDKITHTNKSGDVSQYKKLVTLKGKKGKYKLCFWRYGKKVTLKNGKKDSFKTGVQQIDFDSATGRLSANSADIWTGPYGLSINRIYDKRSRKDKAANKVNSDLKKTPQQLKREAEKEQKKNKT